MRIKRTVFTMRVIRTILQEHSTKVCSNGCGTQNEYLPVGACSPFSAQFELLMALWAQYFTLQKLVSAQ